MKSYSFPKSAIKLYDKLYHLPSPKFMQQEWTYKGSEQRKGRGQAELTLSAWVTETMGKMVTKMLKWEIK